jgi:hypothetical protein
VAAIQKSGGLVWYYHEEGTPPSSPSPPTPGPLWLRRLLGDDFFRTVIAASVESGADFKYVAQLNQLKSLRCRGVFGETGQVHRIEFHHSPNGGPAGSAVMNPEFEHLTALAKLEDLSLGLTDVGDGDLECLKAMPRLRSLDLGYTEVTDAGLRHLEGLSHLEQLCLFKTRVGDAGIEHLRGLTQLKELDLHGMWITDATIGYLAASEDLRHLDLRYDKIGDAGVSRLKGFAHLEELELAATSVTDAGLACLSGLKELRYLDVRDTKATAEGVRKIERALPDCEVEFEGSAELLPRKGPSVRAFQLWLSSPRPPPAKAPPREEPVSSEDPFTKP